MTDPDEILVKWDEYRAAEFKRFALAEVDRVCRPPGDDSSGSDTGAVEARSEVWKDATVAIGCIILETWYRTASHDAGGWQTELLTTHHNRTVFVRLAWEMACPVEAVMANCRNLFTGVEQTFSSQNSGFRGLRFVDCPGWHNESPSDLVFMCAAHPWLHHGLLLPLSDILHWLFHFRGAEWLDPTIMPAIHLRHHLNIIQRCNTDMHRMPWEVHALFHRLRNHFDVIVLLPFLEACILAVVPVNDLRSIVLAYAVDSKLSGHLAVENRRIADQMLEAGHTRQPEANQQALERRLVRYDEVRMLFSCPHGFGTDTFDIAISSFKALQPLFQEWDTLIRCDATEEEDDRTDIFTSAAIGAAQTFVDNYANACIPAPGCSLHDACWSIISDVDARRKNLKTWDLLTRCFYTLTYPFIESVSLRNLMGNWFHCFHSVRDTVSTS